MEKFLSSLALAAGLARGLVCGCLLVPRGLGPHRRRWRWRLKLRLRLCRGLNRLRLRRLRLRCLDSACLAALVLAATPAAPMSLRLPLSVGRNWPQFNLGRCQFCRHACASCCRAGCCLASSGSDFFFSGPKLSLHTAAGFQTGNTARTDENLRRKPYELSGSVVCAQFCRNPQKPWHSSRNSALFGLPEKPPRPVRCIGSAPSVHEDLSGNTLAALASKEPGIEPLVLIRRITVRLAPSQVMPFRMKTSLPGDRVEVLK